MRVWRTGGACLLANGGACANDAQCASGFCVHTSATATGASGMFCEPVDCGACSYLANPTDTTCTNYNAQATSTIGPGGDSDQACNGSTSPAQWCDGNGNCKLQDGQPCTTTSECATSACNYVDQAGDKHAPYSSCGVCQFSVSASCINVNSCSGTRCGSGQLGTALWCDGSGNCTKTLADCGTIQ